MVPSAPADVPAEVERILEALWASGHAAYLVGGGVRDALLRRRVADWDIATDARPEQILELFTRSRYENRFGTVTVPASGSSAPGVEVTTFRRDHRYADHRRPDAVTFTEDLGEDLARRDFTINAIAWGRRPGEPEPGWVDPAGGLADLRSGVVRAVGDPLLRFDEDALRLVRAARLAAQLGFSIEPGTRDAMRATAKTVRWVAAERIGIELRKMVMADPPSTGLALLADTNILEHALPELAAQRGIPQAKVTGDDLWGHCLATLDAAARIDPPNERLRLAALLHDVGKPATFADGRFIGHDKVGAGMAHGLLARMAIGRDDRVHVSKLIAHHMFSYEPRWSAAAVRRFIRRIGRESVDDQIKLRRADNVGSGLPAGAGDLDELEARIAAELAAGVPLTIGDLAINGTDLVEEITGRPGEMVGWLLKYLLSQVLEDPARNNRDALLSEARAEYERMRAR